MSENAQNKPAVVFRLVQLDGADTPPQFGHLLNPEEEDPFHEKTLFKSSNRFDLLQNPLLENYPLYPSASYYSNDTVSAKLKQIEIRHETSWMLGFARFASPILAGAAIGLIKGNHWGSLSGAAVSLLVAFQKVQSRESYLQELKSLGNENDLVSKRIATAEQDLTAEKLELFINPLCFAFGATAAEIFEKQAFRFFSKNVTCKIFAQSLLGGIAGGAVTAANPRTRHFWDISGGILAGSALGAFGGFVGYRIQRWNLERVTADLPDLTADAVLLAEESVANKTGQVLQSIEEEVTGKFVISLESLLRRIKEPFREPHEKIKDLIHYLQKDSSEEILVERLREILRTTADPSRFEFIVQMYQVGYEVEGGSLANSILNVTLNWLHFHTQRSPVTLKAGEIESIFLNVLGRRPLPLDRILTAIKGPEGIWEKLFSETVKGEMKRELIQRIQEANFYAYLYSKAILEKIADGRKTLSDILTEYNWTELTKI